MRSRVPVLVTLFSAATLASARTDGLQPIALDAVPGNLLAAPVTLNGHGPFRMLLDTGSTTTLITPGAAVRSGVPVLSRARLLTPAGATDASYGMVDALSLGTVPARRVNVVITPLGTLQSGEVPLDGILGNDVLREVNYGIDTGRRQLTIDLDGRLARRWQPHSQPLAATHGVATVRARAGQRLVDLVLDSGSSRWVLFDAPGESPRPGQIAIATANATTAARGLLVDELQIGSMTLSSVEALQLPRSPGRIGHGLLPLTQFRFVYVNNREGWIALQ
jgi:predicted aspartyl protease